jgi:hypothetical protein
LQNLVEDHQHRKQDDCGAGIWRLAACRAGEGTHKRMMISEVCDGTAKFNRELKLETVKLVAERDISPTQAGRSWVS